MMNQRGGSSDEESRRCIEDESKRILIMDQEEGSIGGVN